MIYCSKVHENWFKYLIFGAKWKWWKTSNTLSPCYCLSCWVSGLGGSHPRFSHIAVRQNSEDLLCPKVHDPRPVFQNSFIKNASQCWALLSHSQPEYALIFIIADPSAGFIVSTYIFRPDYKSLKWRNVMTRKYETACKLLIYQLDRYSIVYAGFEYRMMAIGFSFYIMVRKKIPRWKWIEKIQ